MADSKGVAIVTGSAQGIGRGIAMRLANDGYNLALFDMPPQEEKLEELASVISSGIGRRAITVYGDVSVEKDIETLVKEAVDKLGGLDVMVANAGAHYLASITEFDEQKWDKVIAVNVKGTMLCYKHAAAQMIKQGRGGRIIGAASTASKQGIAHGGCYCAAKFAVRGLTQSAALELGKHGITVNAYAPGPIDTTFCRLLNKSPSYCATHFMPVGAFDEHFSALEGQKKGTFNERLAKTSAMGRLGTPEDVAALVSFIASAEASFITGQSIVTSGGFHMD